MEFSNDIRWTTTVSAISIDAIIFIVTFYRVMDVPRATRVYIRVTCLQCVYVYSIIYIIKLYIYGPMYRYIELE